MNCVRYHLCRMTFITQNQYMFEMLYNEFRRKSVQHLNEKEYDGHAICAQFVITAIKLHLLHGMQARKLNFFLAAYENMIRLLM